MDTRRISYRHLELSLQGYCIGTENLLSSPLFILVHNRLCSNQRSIKWTEKLSSLSAREPINLNKLCEVKAFDGWWTHHYQICEATIKALTNRTAEAPKFRFRVD